MKSTVDRRQIHRGSQLRSLVEITARIIPIIVVKPRLTARIIPIIAQATRHKEQATEDLPRVRCVETIHTIVRNKSQVSDTLHKGLIQVIVSHHVQAIILVEVLQEGSKIYR